ncbi:MAG: 1-phosphofructokinase family hexose kinase [Armatimonadota bacterium]
MSQIVTLTVNPAVDRIMSIDHVTPDVKLRCESVRRDPGGGGVNVARGIRKLGGDSLAIFTCGGPAGEMYRDLLDREGIPNVPVRIDGLTREHIMVKETSTGRNYRFGEPGPELKADEADACVQAVIDLDPTPDYLVLSGSLPPGAGDDFYALVIGQVAEHTRVVIDTSGPALRNALGAGVYLLKPNARELGELVGRTIEGQREIEDVSRSLVDEGRAEVVVTSFGAGGAVVVTEDLALRIPAPAVKVESKVGAGDTMVAGIVFALDRGDSIREAVRLGTAAGAAAVMDPETGLGSPETAQRLYQQMLEEHEIICGPER